MVTIAALLAALVGAVLPNAASAATSGGWTTTAATSTSSLEPGDALTVTASITADHSQRALVDVEFYDLSGDYDKVHQQVWRRPYFQAGTARTFTTTWLVPAGAVEGDYVVKVGVFDTDWSPLHHWNDRAATFAVSQADAPSEPAPEPSPSEPAPEPSPSEPAPEPSPSEPSDTSLYEPIAGCEEGATVPLGQSPDAVNFEPLGSIWCFNLAEPPAPTRVEGNNSWVDDFTVDEEMLRFDDGDLDYRVFNEAGASSPDRAQHFINQNHWMIDARGGFTGGASLRPDRSFRFEDGKFVVEGDMAAAIPEYGGATWGEITITSAPAPTGVIADKNYAYGQFGGHWAVGCRLQVSRRPVCAVEGPQPDSPPGEGQCSEIAGKYRVLEVSWAKGCGNDRAGGHPDYSAPGGKTLGDYWRACQPDGMDMACRDRFRMEVTKDSIALYVNGVEYFRDAGWPAAYQLPDSFLNGDVYAYQSEWQHRADDHAYRYHWDHFAVNPDGAPGVSEWFGWTPMAG